MKSKRLSCLRENVHDSASLVVLSGSRPLRTCPYSLPNKTCCMTISSSIGWCGKFAWLCVLRRDVIFFINHDNTFRCRCRLTPADHTGIFRMITVMLSPSIMPTSSDSGLVSSALNSVQPNRRWPSSRAKEGITKCKFCTRIVQHAANDMCFGYTPIIITYRSPLSVVENFDTALAMHWGTSQTNLDS